MSDGQSPQHLYPTPDLQREAKAAADGLLDRVWDEDRYPVDPFEIALRSGVGAEILDIPEDVSGILRKRPNEQPIIYVDADDNWRRQRFTCAHELGHFVRRQEAVGRGEDVNDDFGYVDRRSDLSSRGTDPSEMFANAFAANLLMPSSAVSSLSALGMTTQDLAQFFDVSLISMEYRLKSLGLS